MTAPLAFLFFQLLLPPAPPSRVPQPAPDFRLAAQANEDRVLLDISNIYRDSGAVLLARIYIVSPKRDPVLVVVGDGRFDCATRRFSYDTLIAYDRSLKPIDPAGTGPLNMPFDLGSAADQTVTFVCGSAEARMRAQYLGPEWSTAVKLVDPRFR